MTELIHTVGRLRYPESERNTLSAEGRLSEKELTTAFFLFDRLYNIRKGAVNNFEPIVLQKDSAQTSAFRKKRAIPCGEENFIFEGVFRRTVWEPSSQISCRKRIPAICGEGMSAK